MTQPGTLYLVPTPIGNLKDMTFRGIEVLKSVYRILAEDTRTSGKILRHFEINTPAESFHMHNEHRKVEHFLAMLNAGQDLALITDAGTPGISDPGFLLVRLAAEVDVPVISLPGATAFVPALINSALPNHNFVFEGFLPAKKGRKSRLDSLAAEKRTVVLYESPHRVVKTLRELGETLGFKRPASVSREISKKFEETRRGSLAELQAHFEEHPPKGEFVICVAGNSDK